ncbi:MAG: AraC family transcriptional regulator [Lachnospiraceae bacterium]|nr:AraC family transcriptional regulator [Lachnospiraceae bacterium]
MLCATMIFIAAGFFITLKTRLKLQENLDAKANYAAASVQEYLSGMKHSAVFIGKLPSVTTALNAHPVTLDQLANMVADLAPFSSTYSYESICLFFNHSEKVYDSCGGMYTFDDFYNPGLLEQLHSMEKEEKWLINVPYQRYYQPRPAVPVITYMRRLPLYHTQAEGYITVSYQMANLHKLAAEAASYGSYTAAITFEDQLLWSSSDAVMNNWNTACSASENAGILFSAFSSYPSSANSKIQYTFYLSRQEKWDAIAPVLFQCLWSYLAASMIILMASVIYSALMLRPVDAIMKKIGIVPYTENAFNSPDEFYLLNTALDNMNAQVSGIQNLMSQNQQLVKERLLSGILYNYVDVRKLPDEYEQRGLLFPHPIFAVILLMLPSLEDCEDFTRREQLKLLIRANATDAFSTLGAAYSLYIDNNSICIILNSGQSQKLQEELTKICTALKKRMKQSLSVYPLFSIGICSENDPKPWQAWQLARKNLIFTAADRDDFIQFSYQNEFTSSIDPELLAHISRAIIDKEPNTLKEHADTFCSCYLAEAEPEEGCRLASIALCTIYAGLLDVNVDIPDTQLDTFLRKLEHASTGEECRKQFCACLFGMIDAKNKLSAESHGYIQQAIRYLEQNYFRPITIPQIADAVGISPVYLNKLFKLTTGKTLSEYLNFYRTQRSLDMLLHSDETIHHISEAIGYGDVRSYIRFFKKFYQMTPSEYRREKGT